MLQLAYGVADGMAFLHSMFVCHGGGWSVLAGKQGVVRSCLVPAWLTLRSVRHAAQTPLTRFRIAGTCREVVVLHMCLT